ncbi:MAG: glycosyl hydrolase, partial [Victivallaceae bacterium]
MIIEAEQFRKPPLKYRPVAFWFLNHRLEEVELRRQIVEMSEKGMGGIMLHARDGLRTAYLKDEWKTAIDAAVAEAEKHGMDVWLYDENHYPSGTAGDNLQIKCPDRTMKSLKVLHEIIAGSNEEVHFCSEKLSGDAMVLAASFDNAHTADLSSSVRDGVFNWRVPGDWGRTAVISLRETGYTTCPGHKFSAYPDYLDPDLTDEFIALTHQWYHTHFGDKFGKAIRGIFSDNSCGNFGHIRRSVPWGKDMESRFESATGENIRKHIPKLLCPDLADSERSRLMFWKFFGQTYLDSYFGRIKDYCDKVGLLSTGHLCCEDGLGEHVRQIGDYFDVMRHFSFCAVDHLGPAKRGNPLTLWKYGEHPHSTIKNTCSAARFMGLPQVMCESFGCASSQWELDLFETKRISGWLAAIGINVFVPHGLYYSIAG